VSLPARQATPFEVIEPDLVFELLVLLFDGPPLMREADQTSAASEYSNIALIDCRSATRADIAERRRVGCVADLALEGLEQSRHRRVARQQRRAAMHRRRVNRTMLSNQITDISLGE